MGKGLSPGNTASQSTTWSLWESFCHDLRQNPFLQQGTDPIPLLQLFARRYRTGALAPSGSPVQAKMVARAICAVGQTLAALGQPDPRLTLQNTLDLRLARQLAAYGKDDPPPQRNKPVPVSILQSAVEYRLLANSHRANAIVDMLLLGFYFMLRPGEYAHTDSKDSAPFRLKHVHLFLGRQRLNHFTAPSYTLSSATSVPLPWRWNSISRKTAYGEK
jgi:hypothetical protein